MNFLKKFTNLTLEFFKTRGLGFYFLVASLILSIIQLGIYEVAFSTPSFVQYKHFSVTLIASLAVVIGLGMSVSKWTQPFASVVVFFLEVFAFMMFINHGYIYFSELFFAGFTLERASQMYYGYKWNLIIFILIFIISITSMFLKQTRSIKGKETPDEN